MSLTMKEMTSDIKNDGTNHVNKKRRLSEGSSPITNGNAKRCDDEYFLSYNDIELHRTMIEDHVRTSAYQQAIFSNMEEFIKGKVVVDVGCGTGILSMFCAQAGAKKVYAIEASKIAFQAKELVQENSFENIITVFHGRAEEVELPEKVDVVVSEWMGYMMVYETMLPSVLYIRDKWLKPGGKMFPERAVLYMALAETQWIERFAEGTYDFWVSLKGLYGLEMCKLADKAVEKFEDTVHVHMVSQEDLVSSQSVVCDLDLNKVTPNDLKNITHKFNLRSMGAREVNGIVMWFDVMFPDGSKLCTSPHVEDTHWQNSVLPLKKFRVEQDHEITGEIKINEDSENYRDIVVKLEYTVKDGPKILRQFKMDYESGGC